MKLLINERTLLRFTVAVLLIIHGVARVQSSGVGPFGGFLDTQGFPYGIVWAWAVTVIEIVGGISLAAGRFVAPLCVYFVVQMMLGIAMVHFKNGWFVVGLGRNGMEYSVLLVVCLVCILLADKKY